jgi:hypothetical protein
LVVCVVVGSGGRRGSAGGWREVVYLFVCKCFAFFTARSTFFVTTQCMKMKIFSVVDRKMQFSLGGKDSFFFNVIHQNSILRDIEQFYAWQIDEMPINGG